MLPSEGYVATDDGVRLFFQTSGSGAHTVIVPNGLYLVDDFKRLAEGRTFIAYDPRNRGRSDQVTDRAKIEAGILNDVADLDAVRRHFQLEKVDLIGHSYMGLLVILYAMSYGDHVNRVVQLGAIPPNAATQYPPHLTGARTRRSARCSRRSETCRRSAIRRETRSVLPEILVGAAPDLRRQPSRCRQDQLGPVRPPQRAELHEVLD